MAISLSPYFSIAAGETMAPEPWASVFGSCENGALSLMTTVRSSVASAPATGSQSGRLVGLRSASIIRSMFALTAAASTLVPSWKSIPGRSLRVAERRSSAIAKLSASDGLICISASKSSSRS